MEPHFHNLDREILKVVPSANYDRALIRDLIKSLKVENLKIDIENHEVDVEYKKKDGTLEEGIYDIREKEELLDLLKFIRNFLFFDYIYLMDRKSRIETLAYLEYDNLLELYAYTDLGFYKWYIVDLKEIADSI